MIYSDGFKSIVVLDSKVYTILPEIYIPSGYSIYVTGEKAYASYKFIASHTINISTEQLETLLELV